MPDPTAEQPQQQQTRTRAWWGPAVGLSGLGLYAAATVPGEVAGREIYFNVAHPWAVYVFMAALVGLMVYGAIHHIRLWGIGKPTPGLLREIPHRFSNALRLGLAQEKVRRDRYAGIMHWCIFSSIVVLTLVTAQVAIEGDTPIKFLHGTYYLIFSAYGDFFGLVGLVGVGMALNRRYFQDFHRIRWDERIEDHLIIVGLGLVLISGFLVEAFRILATELVQHPDWAPWSFVSYAIARGFTSFHMSEPTILSMHIASWWFHIASAFGWLALIVFTRLDHMFFAPINAFLLRTDSPGRLAKIEDIEQQEIFGVGHVQDFTWKQLFELDACVRCGRCTEVCPANIAGQPLSPMHLIQDLKGYLADVGPAIQTHQHQFGDAGREVSSVAMVGEVIKDETLWACRTCGAARRWSAPRGWRASATSRSSTARRSTSTGSAAPARWWSATSP